MYRITYDGLTIFDPYGNANEVVSDASMSVEVNASAYLDFTMAMTHPLYDTIRERAGVVTLTWDSTVLFEGIIESIEMDIQGNKSISCVSAMDYLNDTHVRPYSTVAGEADLTAPSSVDGYFQWLIDQHNDHVLDTSKIFDIGINQGANLQQNNFIYRSSESEPTTASEITDQILDSLGGYLTMRYEDGRKVLDLYADLHTMNAQIVDFGVNITDFTKTTDTTDQYTAILLHGGSPTFEGGDLEGGDWSHWETHPNTPLVGDKTHGGSVASYFVSGTGEYINDSFFYSRPGRRYKATVYVKNERGSNVTIRGSYQYEQAGGWTTVNVNSSLAVENKGDQWTEFSFDFQPNLSEYTKIRPRWYFDNVGNDGNRRVYLDDFSFSQIEGDNEVSEDPIGLKQVPDGVSSFDADVFKSGDVLYSTSAVERYGYKEEVFEDTTITNIDDLVQAGIKELNKSKEPQITLDIKAVDLALFMEGYTHLNVGDAVRVRSAIHDTDEFLMVNSITLDLQDPGQSEYVIGKAYDSLTGQQSGFLRSLNSGINSSLDAVASLDQTTKDQAIKIGSVEQVANQAQQTANNAQNTANNAQQTANANKEAIDTVKDKQSEQDKLIEKLQQGITDSEADISGINDRLDAVRQEAQTNFETAKAAADAAQSKADAVGADLESFRTETGESIQNVKDSVSSVQSDVDAVTQKADDLASELDGTKATVEQVTTDLGEVKTTVSNAATKADQALRVSTSASQTATEAQTTATSAYQDAQSALTQSSTASQTANAVKTELETKYSTTDEIAEQYATKSLVEQTSQSITSTVEATYATKATVEALENIANNAVQTWMGSGVPTLSNKPASDWNTAELKSQHSGDIYYDTDTGYSYRFGSSDGKNYSWSLIKDTDISKAVADAAKAQQTAEGVSDEVTQLKTDIPATYATKTEVEQTTDSIKSSVSEVATTANSALSKATTVEQTAKGLQTTVTEQAEKLDGAVTTISQVSQKVDSVSSTITQVSGRVDDVEDKADAAQGTANSALSQASRVEQNLNSFKTSVSRDYQTKTDALSQKSELEQNINSFKTTVSETYTTKDEFNNLKIGSTNLLRGTEDFGNPDFGNLGSFTNTGETYNGLTVIGYGGQWNGVSWSGFDPEPNVSYVFSFWAKADTGLNIFTVPRYSGGPNYTPKEFIVDEIYQLPHAAASGTWEFATSEDDATEWRRYWLRFHVTATLPDDLYIRIENGKPNDSPDSKKLYLCGYKLERATKPTDWSPAPEDFDGKYTSKTEFKQTTDKISATATAASQNASSALSKVSSLEVSVDGIDTKVEEVASDADEAVKTASQVSQRVDSLSSTITQVSGRVDDVEDKADAAQGTANSALSQASRVEQNLNSFKTSVSRDYQTKTDALSQKSELEQNINSFKTTVSETYTTKDEFNALEIGGTNLLENSTFDSGTKSPWSDYLNGGSATIVDGYDGHKGITIARSNYTGTTRCGVALYDGFLIKNIQSGDKFTLSAWIRINEELSGTNTVNTIYVRIKQPNSSATYDATLEIPKNGNIGQWQRISTTFEIINVDENNPVTQMGMLIGGNGSVTISCVKLEKGTKPTDWSPCPADMLSSDQAAQTYSTKSYVDQTSRTVSLGVVEEYKKGQHGSALATQSDITAAKDSITSTVSQTYTTKTEFNDLVNSGVNLFSYATVIFGKRVGASGEEFSDSGYALSQFIPVNPNTKYTLAIYRAITESPYITIGFYSSDSVDSFINRPLMDTNGCASGDHWTVTSPSNAHYARVSLSSGAIEQAKFEIGSTPTTWSPALNGLLSQSASGYYATKTEVKQTSDSLTVTISSAVSKAESAATAASNAQNTANNAQSTANAAAGSSTNYIKNGGPNGMSNPIAGWTVSGNVYKHTFPGGQNHVDLGYTTLAHPIVAGRKYRLSLDARVTSGTFSSSDYFVFGLSNGWQSIRAQALTGSWKTYSGVVASSKEATQVYMSSYVGSSGSKVVEMRNVSMTDVTETYSVAVNAQNTANAANSNATNANNRVGNLETCIKMTSDGVRVGKISNGNFTGYSALVNSAGSFDVLDGSGEAIAKFSQYGLNVKAGNSRSMYMGVASNQYGYIGSTPTLDGATAGQGFDVGMTMGFLQGDYLNIINNLGGIGLAGKGIQLTPTGGNRVKIGVMDVRGAGVVLFDRDDSNNYASIDIAPRNFGDFNYIMCFFETNDGNYFGGTAYHPNGKEYNFSTMGGQSTDMSYLKGTRWGFNGTRAERKTTFEIGPGYSRTVNDSVLHIVAIVGFDYYKTSD